MDKPKTKHTSNQRKHLTTCAAYLTYMKNNSATNSITLSAGSIAASSTVQTPFFPIINKIKRDKLDKMAAMAVYCRGRPLSLYEDPWMNTLFTKGIGYKPPRKN